MPVPMPAAPPAQDETFQETDDAYYSDTDTTVVRVYHDPNSAWNTMQFRVYYEQGAYITEEDKARQAKNGQVIWQGDNRASAAGSPVTSTTSHSDRGIPARSSACADRVLRRPRASYAR